MHTTKQEYETENTYICIKAVLKPQLQGKKYWACTSFTQNLTSNAHVKHIHLAIVNGQCTFLWCSDVDIKFSWVNNRLNGVSAFLVTWSANEYNSVNDLCLRMTHPNSNSWRQMNKKGLKHRNYKNNSKSRNSTKSTFSRCYLFSKHNLFALPTDTT